ncbi:MAG: PaaI family thioesterase [Pseudomonadales bacterium]
MDIHDPFSSPDTKDPLDDEWAAKRRVSEATRKLIETLVTVTTSAEELNEVADNIAAQADRLAQSERLYGRVAFERAEDGKYGTMASLGYELNPLDGRSNPIAAPITVWMDGDKAYAKANMGWQYEGPPGCVHGGFVAALFDQFLGVGQKLTGQPGMTGTLTVKYLKPTPIDTDLRMEARVERVEGRKNYLVGEMWAGDVLTATSAGVFISITPEMYRKLLAAKTNQTAD